MQAEASSVAAIVADEKRRIAFRYLGAPPISEDDLKTLAETRLTAAHLERSPDEARRVRDLVLQIIDPHRFPWVRDSRAPTAQETEVAVVSSALLVAARRVETERRNEAKRAQETQVRDVLLRLGFTEVPRCEVRLAEDAPPVRAFCRESKLGDTRADFIARLPDHRIMPIECKVSNSSVNSYKRVNHEAAGKAAAWLRAFGTRTVVPAAALAGVFNPANLATAQQSQLFLFCQHRLADLADFVRGCAPAKRPPRPARRAARRGSPK